MRRITGCAAAMILLAGCSSDPSLQESDPNGWKACQVLIEANQSSDVTDRLGSILEEGKLAIVAESTDIKASASKLGGASSMADSEKLTAACEAHGVKIPQQVAVFDPDNPAGLPTTP